MKSERTLRHLLQRINDHWPEVVSPESDLAIIVIRLADHIRYRTEQALHPFNLSQAAFEVLFALRSARQPRQMTPKQLTDAVLITSGGMTKVLIHLENMGAIERRTHDHDGRSKVITLTMAGSTLAEQATLAVTRADKTLFGESSSSTVLSALNAQLLELNDRIEDA